MADGESTPGKGRGNREPMMKPKSVPQPRPPQPGGKRTEIVRCEGCGNKGHVRKDCWLTAHPEFNPTVGVPWAESAVGRRAKAEVPPRFWIKDERAATAAREFKSKCCTCGVQHVMGLRNVNADVNRYTYPLTLFVNRIGTVCRALVDTGAVVGDYISLAVARRLLGRNSTAIIPDQCRVCTVFGDCKHSWGSVVLEVEFSDELINSVVNCNHSDVDKMGLFVQKLPLHFQIIDMKWYDVIIGRPTIQRITDQFHNLCTKGVTQASCHDSILPDQQDGGSRTTAAALGYTHGNVGCPPRVVSTLLEGVQRELEGDEDLTLVSYDLIADLDLQTNTLRAQDCLPDKIFGSPELQEQLKRICHEFSHIFSRAVRPDAADAPPMEIVVDELSWRRLGAARSPRPQSSVRQAEIQQLIEQMLELKIIQVSEATEYSQVHLVKKPNGKWRFCIDYRLLNEVTMFGHGWPIPNVMSMLRRIGEKRPAYFAVIDLTSGYHQMPVALNSRKYTAFVTYMGVYEFCRVPFGLKAAPSYFQRIMCTRVLAGILYTICEVYIDDVIIFAATGEALLANLRLVFERFSRYRILINPDKVVLGQEAIEYVGHILSKEGITFSNEKREKVYTMPLPMSEKSLRAFLGLANYFRDHVRNHSIITEPLQQLLQETVKLGKRAPIRWTSHTTEAFERIKDEVNRCPSLYFMDSQAPIFLHTDASDYGIGGYLFQLVEGLEQPVAFVSKALTSIQRRWSVPEKEAYAIVYCFEKLSNLIRDVQFTLRTDHRNLTFVNTSGSAKVIRWKLALQEYNFNIEFIEGSRNVIADGLSRHLAPSGEGRDPSSSLVVAPLHEEHFRVPQYWWTQLSQVHNTKAGHAGVEVTLSRLKQLHLNHKLLRAYTARFIQLCPICQKLSTIKPVINAGRYKLARYQPWERIAVDTVGPLRKDPSGYEYILVVICCFTRFVELHPVRTTSGAEAAKALLQYVGRYGCPSEIISDNGSQFRNDVIKALCTLLMTDDLKILAYSHEENGLVERVNKETLRHLRALLMEKRNIEDWVDSLPLVQRILNATPHRAIGVAPAQLLFGNTVTLDRQVIRPPDADHGDVVLSAWLDKMLATQMTLLSNAQEYQDERYNAREQQILQQPARPVPQYEDNSYALLAYPVKPPEKLMTPLKGPVRVLKSHGSTVTVQDLGTLKTSDVHISRLRPFRYDPERTNPTDVAYQSEGLYAVERILNHRGTPRRRAEMTFEVKWLGYDEPTWESWENVRTCKALHDYLTEHNMRSLISKLYR